MVWDSRQDRTQVLFVNIMSPPVHWLNPTHPSISAEWLRHSFYYKLLPLGLQPYPAFRHAGQGAFTSLDHSRDRSRDDAYPFRHGQFSVGVVMIVGTPLGSALKFKSRQFPPVGPD